ncbi:DUF4145 domain-containing protein [Enterobacter hormaechei]|uniref:DUF4145 domain-containing protein n=1 Tax=Enterobacter hormaechei TaxID=158836 RepID=UPI0009B40F1C|nr:DUF4145 domain-containing protein [Enterobacter hormaechei]MDR9967941.1 DUF4145 domain-containing protein [Enterobacter hormaechei subsp. xiangfangensis]
MGRVTETFSEGRYKNAIESAFCETCRRKTKHLIVTSYELTGQEECGPHGYTIDWTSSYQVIQCRGCEVLSFRKENWFSEDMYLLEDGEHHDGTTVTLYPKRSETTRTPKTFLEVPRRLRNLYIESVDTFNNDSYILTAAGLRALIEGLCAELKIKDGPVERTEKGVTKIVRARNLEGKIAGLKEKGILTAAGAVFLNEHRFMGNEAVHSLRKPSREDISLAFDLIEHCFETIFVMPAKASELEESRKRRSGTE